MIFPLMAIVIIASACGDVSVTRGMRSVGEVTSFRPRALISVALRGIRNGFLWLGVMFKSIAFFSFLALLSRADLSWVVPAAASTYVVDTLAAKYLLGERINRTRWAGAFCVCMGVILISLPALHLPRFVEVLLPR
jgi:drug/metabolite transporter (DMT)-like permease